MTTTPENALGILLFRQTNHLPNALEELKKFGKKKGHWAWWAFPTEKSGAFEPNTIYNSKKYGKSYITTNTAKQLINDTPKIWELVLCEICNLLEKSEDNSLKDVLPIIDHERVRYFIKFWNTINDKPAWLINVLKILTKYL